MATGFFGKLPARGDFVARGLPPGARPVVDRWLTRMLAPAARGFSSSFDLRANSVENPFDLTMFSGFSCPVGF